MLIKNIIISGFRSYREQLFPDGFSPRVNVIVGKNGSGKSNFFAAIQFVLGKKFANLSPVERKELFHMGSGKTALSVFVEIVFDNSDGRLVIPGRGEEKEVRIRRTVGLKQDDFRVNDRKFSHVEVYQLLESAGFSSSNPYNIVEQGKVSSLVNMSEEARFQLIKDVAGTKVYEDRRDESKKILEDTKGKLVLVDESIQKLEDRLKDLEEDSKELKEFQRLDVEKKNIEYSIFKAELDESRKELEKIDFEYRDYLSSTNSHNKKSNNSESLASANSARLLELNAKLRKLEVEKSNIEKEMDLVNSKQAITELEVISAVTRKNRAQEERDALNKERLQLTQSLNSTSEKLSSGKLKLTSAEKNAELAREKVQFCKRSVESLQERRNRASLFKNKKERDTWMLEEITKKRESVKKITGEISYLQRQLTGLEGEICMVQSALKDLSVNSEGTSQEELQRQEELQIVSNKRDDLNHKRRKLWQQIHEQEAIVQGSQERAEFFRQQYERSVRYDIRQGLQSLNELLHELNDPSLSSKVHGKLIDLITIEEGFTAAVDITAGNALFNVVVDSFDTSAYLLEQMNKKKKPGRLTFFPLDTCKGETHTIPSNEEVELLVSKVSAESKFKGVVMEVFGRTAVVGSLKVGMQLLNQLKCDIVTVDGDQIGRKGAFTGGFVDVDRLKLVTYEKQRTASKKYEEERQKFDELCQNVAVVEQNITEVLNSLNALQSSTAAAESSADSYAREKRAMEERLARLQSRREKMEISRAFLQKAISETDTSIAHLEEEAKKDFQSTWTEEDQTQLQSLSESLALQMEASLQLQNEVLKKETEVQLLEDSISHFTQRILTLDDRIREIGKQQRSASSLDVENTAITKEFSILKERLEAIGNEIDTLSKEKGGIEAFLETMNTERISSSKRLEEQRNRLLHIEAKRSNLIQRREEISQKMRRIGIPPTSDPQYTNQSIAKLMHLLKEVNAKLQNFSHVNRKAADQLSTVVASRNDLKEQRNQLIDELKGIHELLDHLEAEKDQVIERTYKQIQFQFEEVFKELVGSADCSAQLVLVKPSNFSSSKDYTGAKMLVSFGGGKGVSELAHLSGGQKSLVAIALVFAIQRCDPAPFYLFDEVDAALDAEYRMALAKIIKKQSANCQFIFTTFKTEMLSIADKVLGIFFHNKVTRIQTISQEEGAQLLKHAAAEERKRHREIEEAEEEEIELP